MSAVFFSSRQKTSFLNKYDEGNQPFCKERSFLQKIPPCIYITLTRPSFWFYILLFVIQCCITTKLSIIVTLTPILSTIFSAFLLDFASKSRRKRYIKKINNRTCKAMREGEWCDVKWSEIKVGDLILLEDSSIAPADLVLLRTSDGNQASIESHIIDGISQWQPKSPPLLIELSYESALLNTDFMIKDITREMAIDSNLPQSKLSTKYNFSGVLEFENKSVELNNKNFIERYSIIHHVGPIICGVVFIGEDCTTVKNNPPKKSLTKVETFLRKQNEMQMIIVVTLALFSTIISCFCYKHKNANLYSNYFMFFIQVFIDYLIILSPIVPLELFFFVDIVLLFNTKIIQHNYSKAYINSIELANEITSIDTLIMSKSMLFDRKPIVKRILLNNNIYGGDLTIKKYVQSIDTNNSDNVALPRKSFFDPELKSNDETKMFFLHLTLCHSASIIGNSDKFSYISRYHDDEQLLNLAAEFGFMLVSRTAEKSVVLIDNKTYEFKTKRLFHTTIKHPKVSIIVEDSEGKLILLTRGVFKVMGEMIKNGESYLNYYNDFRGEGMHVESCTYKYISREEYRKFEAKLDEIGDDAIEMQYSVIEEFENNSTFLALLGFEDHPRDGSLFFLSKVKSSFNKIVLASQTKGTSLVVSEISLGIVSPDSVIGEITGSYLEAVDISISYLLERDSYDILIISGQSVEFLQSSEYADEVLQLIAETPTIIIQKANENHVACFVKYLRDNIHDNIMAVGHSVYDNVYMEQASFSVSVPTNDIRPNSIGADLVVKDFYSLSDIVFIDGCWLKERIISLIWLTEKRNCIFAFLQYIYSVYVGFEGESPFPSNLYPFISLLFTFIPLLLRSILNKRLSKKDLSTNPSLYGLEKVEKPSFVNTFALAVVSFFISFLLLESAKYSLATPSVPHNFAVLLPYFSYVILTVFIFISNLSLIPTMSNCSAIQIFATFGTLVMYIAVMHWYSLIQKEKNDAFLIIMRSWKIILYIISVSFIGYVVEFIYAKISYKSLLERRFVSVEENDDPCE